MTNLSVIIPVAPNRSTNLRNTLYALSLQTLPKDQWECIVVNDGADEDFERIMRQTPDIDFRYIKAPKFNPDDPTKSPDGTDSPPRNKGARLARYSHLIFLDSDVILDKNALSLYADDFDRIPDRVVAGMYDWMAPIRLDEEDIENGLDYLYYYEGDNIRFNLPVLAFPEKTQTHMVNRDIRFKMFDECSPDDVFTGPGNMNCYLGALSGNIGYSADTFWRAGGFWPTLTAGVVDDGSLGLSLWHHSVRWEEFDGQMVMTLDQNDQPIVNPEFGISFDKRIRGAHQYHSRNVGFIQAVTSREVDYIDRIFRLNRYSGSGIVEIPQNVADASARGREELGVQGWRKSW